MGKKPLDDNDEFFDDELTMKALCAAKKAFFKTISDEGYDSAFWDIRFTAWMVDSEFTTRLKRIEIEEEVKDRRTEEE